MGANDGRQWRVQRFIELIWEEEEMGRFKLANPFRRESRMEQNRKPSGKDPRTYEFQPEIANYIFVFLES